MGSPAITRYTKLRDAELTHMQFSIYKAIFAAPSITKSSA